MDKKSYFFVFVLCYYALKDTTKVFIGNDGIYFTIRVPFATKQRTLETV